MKKGIVLLFVAVFAVMAIGCGDDDDSGNVCDQAGDIYLDAMDEACADETDCCYCTCLADMQMPDYTVTDSCTCVDMDDGNGEEVECTGDVETQAQDCVDDAAACKQPVIDGIGLACDAEELIYQ